MLGKAAGPPALMTLIVLSGLSVVSLNMFLPSLANIAREFQADYALVNLCIAGYAAVSCVLQLVMGPLSDRLGRRPVILAALLLFLVASLGCLLASNVWVFLTFRLMQAVIAPAYAVSVAIIRDISAGSKAASFIGYVAMTSAIAPMLAPMLGGALDDLYGWRLVSRLFSPWAARPSRCAGSICGRPTKRPQLRLRGKFDRTGRSWDQGAFGVTRCA